MSLEPIRRQVIRSSTSVGANYNEAIAASSIRDFTIFLNHALKSANETKYWLFILGELSPDKDELMKNLERECFEIASILGASVSTMRKKKT